MFNRSLLQSYLGNTLSVSNYQIWLYHPIEHEWLLIETITDKDAPPFLESPPFSHTKNVKLDYPHDYQVAVVFAISTQFPKREILQVLFHLLNPLYSHFALKSKDVELEKLIEGIQNITGSLDLDELLTKILDNVAAVVPGANTSAFWLYNPAIDRLVCKAYRGWKREIEKVQYKIGESVTGKTYRDGKPRIYYSFRKANEAMRGTSKKNLRLLQEAFHNGRVKASVTVPVSFHNEITGILSIHQDENARKLTEWDLQLIKALSAQIAIAIENARLFSEIKRKNQVLIKRNEVHATLTKLSLLNKGAGAMAKELNRMIRASVAFVDLLEEEYYPSRQPRYFSMDELSKIIGNRNVPIHLNLHDNEDKSFYLYPIFVGSACSGCLIVSGEPALTQLEQMIVERGGVFLALEMAKRHSVTEVYFKKTHDFYHELLSNENPYLLHKQGLDLGIDLHRNLFSIIVEFSNFHDLQVLETKVHHFVWTIKQKLSETNKLVFGNHNKVTLLFSLEDPDDLSNIIKSLDYLMNDWQQSEGINLYAGAGRVYKGIKSISKTHNEANKALSYLISCQTPGLIQYTEIGINRLFLNHSTEELKQFVQEIFSPLKERNNELEETLVTYISTNRSAAKTAAELHIHINTLYQRLKKIEELLELSLEDPESMLKIQLACHLRETYV